jgi:hypothetical protein
MARRQRTVSAQNSSFRDFSSKKVQDRVWREASREVRSESRIISRRSTNQ